jgi:hypothetical protein
MDDLFASDQDFIHAVLHDRTLSVQVLDQSFIKHVEVLAFGEPVKLVLEVGVLPPEAFAEVFALEAEGQVVRGADGVLIAHLAVFGFNSAYDPAPAHHEILASLVPAAGVDRGP